MTAKSVDFSNAIHALMEVYARYLCIYHSRKWRAIHPITSRGDGTQLLPLYSLRWLPTPDISVMASIVDAAEQQSCDPSLLRGVAAIFQRAAVVDPSVRSDLDELSSKLSNVDLTESVESALLAHRELEVLLSSPEDRRPLESILGDDCSRPELLLKLARRRLARNESPWCAMLTVIHKLKSVASDLVLNDSNLSESEKCLWIQEQAALDFTTFRRWIEVAGLEADEIALVSKWMHDLMRDSDGPEEEV